MKTGILYLVATPIGNLGDFSSRAVDTLNEVDLIAAEDTRHSRPLLQHAGIKTPCQPYHAHNELSAAKQLVAKLCSGLSIALISDAGTPLISDPGSLLVAQAREADISVVPIPGPCAAITALSASGIASNDFRFVGFLSAKGAKRERQLTTLCDDASTLILYESVHRIDTLMDTLKTLLKPDRVVCLARELTKRFEQIKTAPIEQLHAWFVANPDTHRGEYVVIISGTVPESTPDSDNERILSVLLTELPVKKAVALATKLTGERKNHLYELALKLNGNDATK